MVLQFIGSKRAICPFPAHSPWWWIPQGGWLRL